MVQCSGKNTTGKAGDGGHASLIPGSGRSPGGGNGNPLQYCCLENSMDTEEPGPWGCKESDITEHAYMHSRQGQKARPAGPVGVKSDSSDPGKKLLPKLTV